MKVLKKVTVMALVLMLIAGLFPTRSAHAATKPAKAKVTAKANDDGTSVTLTIAKTKNAQGYKIMVKKPGAKKFTKLATISEDGTAKRTYTAKKLTEGEYQFKVRAYLKNGKKTVWGKYSKVAKVKVSKAAETPATKKVTKQDWAGEYITDDGGSMVVTYSESNGVLSFTEIKFKEKQDTLSVMYNIYVDDSYPIKERDTSNWDFDNMIRASGAEGNYYIISFNPDGTISLRLIDMGGSRCYNVFKNGNIPVDEPEEPAGQKQTVKYVSTLSDLKNIEADNSSIKYVLKNDIDMTDWKEPINSMYCSIDGAGYTLKNLSVPFVRNVWGGVIENLNFDICITSLYVDGNAFAAPVCQLTFGKDDQDAVMRNCKVTGTINLKNGEKYNRSNFDGYVLIAGIVGSTVYGLVEKCVSEVDITVNEYSAAAIGGITAVTNGRSRKAAVSECLNAGNIKAEDGDFWGVGAIVGRGESSALAKDCINTGRIHVKDGTDRLGGGLSGSGSQMLENCVNLGTADRGVFGSTIDELVVISWFSGGTEFFKNVYITSNYEDGFGWDYEPVEVQGVNKVSDITDKSAFKGLDFDKIWEMTENGPMLRNIPE